MQAEGREMLRRQALEWFSWMDHILDVHRANFVYREQTPEQLKEHERLFREAIRTTHFFHIVLSDVDFGSDELVSGLSVRIKQLKDAYNTFNDSTLTDETAQKIIAEVFPT